MPPVVKQHPTKLSPLSKPDDMDVLLSKSGFQLHDWMNLLVYGESGSGKTTFWATAPGPILCIICSGSKKSGELKSVDTEDAPARERRRATPIPQAEIAHASAANTGIASQKLIVSLRIRC